MGRDLVPVSVPIPEFDRLKSKPFLSLAAPICLAASAALGV